MAGTTDDELNSVSKRLLQAAENVQEMERRKRGTARSSDEFHELADRIEEKSREVFAFAHQERVGGSNDSSIPAERAEQEPADWSDGDRLSRSG